MDGDAGRRSADLGVASPGGVAFWRADREEAPVSVLASAVHFAEERRDSDHAVLLSRSAPGCESAAGLAPGDDRRVPRNGFQTRVSGVSHTRAGFVERLRVRAALVAQDRLGR